MRIASAHTPHHTTPERNLEAPRRPPTQPRAPAEAKEGEGIVSAAGRILARPGWEVADGTKELDQGRVRSSVSICEAAYSEWTTNTVSNFLPSVTFHFCCYFKLYVQDAALEMEGT